MPSNKIPGETNSSTRQAAKPVLLVVDDHPIIGAEVAKRLATAFPGYDTRTVGSGEEAVKLAKDGHVAVAIMDISLPGISGIEATRQILSNGSRTQIVMLSIHEDEHYIEGALAAGASAYIKKRTMGRELVPALRKLLGEDRTDPTHAASTGTQGGAG